MPAFKDLWTKVRIVARKKNLKMLSVRIPRKNSVSSFFLQSVLPLLPDILPKTDANKNGFITMDLKSQAGVDTSGSYKKHLALFDEGTHQKWIDAQKGCVGSLDSECPD